MEPVWKGGGPDAPPSTTNSPPHIVQVTVFVSLSQHVTTLLLDGGEPIHLRRRHGGWPQQSLCWANVASLPEERPFCL